MFHQAVIGQSLDTLLADPGFAELHLADLRLDDDYPVEDCHEFKRSMDALLDEEHPGQLVRPLTGDEERFILHEQLRSKIDYRYAAVRYHFISAEGMGLMPMFPLWESQEITLDAIARTELLRQQENWGALLFNILKARQLGVSTLFQSIMAHYATTQAHQRMMCASDVESSSVHVFGMFETVLENLPWWLKPKVLNKTDGRRRRFDTGTIYWAEWGKSGRGGLQEKGGAKGNLGRGKSQPLSEPILTPRGFVPMGSLQLHDLVVGSNGQATPVIGVYPQGDQPVYELTFSDGTLSRASADHLWSVTECERSNRRHERIVTTQDLVDSNLRAHKDIYRWQFPLLSAPVQFTSTPLALHPYVVGVLLGDGILTQGTVRFSSMDEIVLQRLRALLPANCILTHTDRCNYRITSIPSTVSLQTRLRRLGIWGARAEEKHIPPTYLRASVNDRLAILAGLLDTDGWVDKDGRVEYGTVSPTLAADLTDLVRGLGGVVRLRTRMPWFTHKGERRQGQLAYVLTVVLPRDLMQALPLMPRKAVNLRGTEQRLRRALIGIRYVGVEPCQCIAVAAADHLYVTRDFVLTHNTASKFHITEASTWEHPEQLNDGFFPTIPPRLTSFGGVESTAKGRGNWWHHWFTQTDRGQTDFVNIFIPWYAEVTKYSRPAPLDWIPDAETLAHAARAEREGPKYLKKPVSLTRDQLYFWERKRREFDEQDALYKFYEEYPAEPEESFQYSGRSCFPIKTIERIRLASRAPLVVCDLRPQTAAAHVVHEARERQQAADLGLAYTPAATPVAPTSGPSVPILLPDGYGFKALNLPELKDRKGDLMDLLQVWEAPRRRGPRDYVAAVDVSDGLGADRSVVDIFRIPTILEPCEQVAQFITERRTPVELAYIIDALGRWYRSADDLEAMAMIECNNHGLSTQDTLQLHLGYGRFYIWEYYDAALPAKRMSNKIGWVTTQRTRPLILVRLLDAVKAVDPLSGKPDLILHSPWTLQDMQDFGTPTGRIADGEAVAGRYDDAVLSAAIGIYGAWRMAGGEHVPIDERRRTQAAEKLEREQKAESKAVNRDWRNSPVPADWAPMHLRPEDDSGDPDVTTPFGTPSLPAEQAEDAASLYFRYSDG